MKTILRWFRERNEWFRFVRRVKIASKHKGMSSIPFDTIIKSGANISLKGSISLGPNCRLLCWDEYTSAIKRQKLNPVLEIGNNFRATRNLTIQCAESIHIGDDVLISSDVFIIDYNHLLDPRNANYLDGKLQTGNVFIDDGAWIGNNVVILPRARIGKKAVVGAGSVVTGIIGDYCIAVGNPARSIKRWDFLRNKWIRIEG